MFIFLCKYLLKKIMKYYLFLKDISIFNIKTNS